ncbi:hypothetical protein [Streptomyces sp. EKS3.2]|uniref:hypothetical protein n=1 Tax=Streptomyces sp. EKS3.2 TaxID=3461008 RepID=UPI004041ACC3
MTSATPEPFTTTHGWEAVKAALAVQASVPGSQEAHEQAAVALSAALGLPTEEVLNYHEVQFRADAGDLITDVLHDARRLQQQAGGRVSDLHLAAAALAHLAGRSTLDDPETDPSQVSVTRTHLALVGSLLNYAAAAYSPHTAVLLLARAMAGVADEAAQRAADRHMLQEDWHAAGMAAERAHQDYLAQWAAEKVPAACTVVFQAEDSKNGPQWSDQKVTFLGSSSGAADVPLASYDSRNDPELVKSLDALTELTPPAHEDDELHVVVSRARP